ncbi:MAG: hypothetical protein Q9159_000461 [Coniocarpon cinnabarinum]
MSSHTGISAPTGKPFVAAVLAEAVQLSDIMCIDLLASCSTEYAQASSDATTNRGFLKQAQQLAPAVKWEYARWVVEKKEGGELWTSGGAQAGFDMMAEYLRSRFPAQAAGWAIEALDVAENERGIAYKEPAASFM